LNRQSYGAHPFVLRRRSVWVGCARERARRSEKERFTYSRQAREEKERKPDKKIFPALSNSSSASHPSISVDQHDQQTIIRRYCKAISRQVPAIATGAYTFTQAETQKKLLLRQIRLASEPTSSGLSRAPRSRDHQPEESFFHLPHLSIPQHHLSVCQDVVVFLLNSNSAHLLFSPASTCSSYRSRASRPRRTFSVPRGEAASWRVAPAQPPHSSK